MRYIIQCILLLFITSQTFYSQVVRGKISDEQGNVLTGAYVRDISTQKYTASDQTGSFELQLPADQLTSIEISYIGTIKDTLHLQLKPGEIRRVAVTLYSQPGTIDEVVVESVTDRAEALQQLNIRTIGHIPLPSGSIESLLSTMGASNRNEMSSQYSVRGGNFDENLIYVNGIEIYRPLLVKSGQQEGLSFINPSMVSSVQFAAGGFDARYGDKMSSVLDIRYKRPTHYAGSLSGSLLGTAAHLEGSSFHNRLTHITGIRYKTNQYLLKNMQTSGDFDPHFLDIQTYITYDLPGSFEISFLGNLARNTYRVIPQSRQTEFGTYQQPMRFTVYYEGQEEDRFSTLLGALSLDFKPSEKLSLRLTFSGFDASESVTYDILGMYRIDLLDNTPGSTTAGDSILNLGYGSSLKHARNYLYADIVNLGHKGSYQWNGHHMSWGIQAQSEKFNDKIREWEMIDSAGYSIPYVDDQLILQNVVISKNRIKAYRFAGYVQDIKQIYSGTTEILLNAGARFSYLNTNGQFTFSPRFGVNIIPDWQRKFSFRASLGWYHQPPFYKEMRNQEGQLFPNTKAQQAVHFLLGTNYDFILWERPFRFSAEAFYKKLDHLVPYVVDDVEIQYLPQYTAKGFATGIEFKINGEFVKNAESWASLSLLQTREDRIGDGYGSYPRPTNQLINFGLYFQDYFPDNPSIRVHLHTFYGSRLPYNSTEYDNPRRYFHLQSYRRIDIGLSKSLLTDRNGNKRNSNIFNDIWFSIEVFNLFGFNNQASYQWIRTVNNQEGNPNMFAVPNYLTGRLLNFKLALEF